MSVGLGLVEIDQYEIAKTISINRFTDTILPGDSAETTDVQQGDDVQLKNSVSPNPEQKARAKKYVIDRFVQHINTYDEPHYVIGWYELSKQDETVELADIIPQHFQDAYCLRVHKHLSTRERKQKRPHLRRTKAQTRHRTSLG